MSYRERKVGRNVVDYDDDYVESKSGIQNVGKH